MVKYFLLGLRCSDTNIGQKSSQSTFLFGLVHLLSDESRQPWEKIIQAQITKCLWEDIYGVTHDNAPTKTWDSFLECITFHLQQVFRHEAGKALKYYITSMLRKPNRFQFISFWYELSSLIASSKLCHVCTTTAQVWIRWPSKHCF